MNSRKEASSRASYRDVGRIESDLQAPLACFDDEASAALNLMKNIAAQCDRIAVYNAIDEGPLETRSGNVSFNGMSRRFFFYLVSHCVFLNSFGGSPK
jgi:hypothetical protein